MKSPGWVKPALGLVVFLPLLATSVQASEVPQKWLHSAVESEANRATIAFTGDTLIHLGVSGSARRNGLPYDFRPMFDGVRHILGPADLAICHLEVPLSPTSTNLSGYPLFNAPSEVAAGLNHAGFDGCSTASNHSYDQGSEGVLGTLKVLEEAGLAQTGMASSSAQALQPLLYEVGDLTLGHLSATYWLNGLEMPADSQWLVQQINTEQITAAAYQARVEGADLVVVSLHCCTEYRREPTEFQRDLSHRLVASAFIDLVVTHHSHWVGPIEKVGGEFILHGLGNFLSGQTHTSLTTDGVIALVDARRSQRKWRFDSVEVVPTYVQRSSHRVFPAEEDSASYKRTMEAIRLMGEYTPVFRPPGLTKWQRSLID